MIKYKHKFERTDKLHELARGILAVPLGAKYDREEIGPDTKEAIEKLKNQHKVNQK